MSEIRKIRVLVVDDSLLFRETLSKKLALDKNIEVVATAVDAYDATQKIEKLNPDVVLLDVEMPKIGGIEFLKQLIPNSPIKVVVVTSLPINAFEAMDAGAVDFVRKPGTVPGLNDMDGFVKELIGKIKIAFVASIKNIRTSANLISNKLPQTLKNVIDSNLVIALGASTGGTEAILEVIRDLPITTPGIVVVQHMPPVFTKMYAERLNKICKMEVKEAENGDRVKKGRVIIAAGGFHLTLHKDARGYFVKSTQGEKVSGHCPSVDVLFESVSKTAGKKGMGVIMTGMGADGAKGLLLMKKAGSFTVGQDKESCVVYGMPMVAYNIGGVQKQMALGDISSGIIAWINRH